MENDDGEAETRPAPRRQASEGHNGTSGQPASGLGAVVTEPDFADYIKEGLSTYKSDGMVP